jgi:hypothetical protein
MLLHTHTAVAAVDVEVEVEVVQLVEVPAAIMTPRVQQQSLRCG